MTEPVKPPKRHRYAWALHRRWRKYRVRCDRCGHRRTTTRYPSSETRRVTCACGSSAWHVDWYRTTGIESRKVRCHCSGYHYPHTRNSPNCDTGKRMREWQAEVLGEVAQG